MHTVVIDTNVIILGLLGKNAPAILIDNLNKLSINCNFTICDQIKQELERNLPKKFHKYIYLGPLRYDNNKIPEKLIKKYTKQGLKKGDRLVAAFAEYIKADFLISENRHFIRELKSKKFKSITSQEFLDELLRTQ